METEVKKLKENLKERLEKLSEERLQEMSRFLETLEKENNKSDLLSFAGSWSDLEADAFEGLTKELGERRKTSRKRYTP